MAMRIDDECPQFLGVGRKTEFGQCETCVVEVECVESSERPCCQAGDLDHRFEPTAGVWMLLFEFGPVCGLPRLTSQRPIQGGTSRRVTSDEVDSMRQGAVVRHSSLDRGFCEPAAQLKIDRPLKSHERELCADRFRVVLQRTATEMRQAPGGFCCEPVLACHPEHDRLNAGNAQGVLRAGFSAESPQFCRRFG